MVIGEVEFGELREIHFPKHLNRFYFIILWVR